MLRTICSAIPTHRSPGVRGAASAAALGLAVSAALSLPAAAQMKRPAVSRSVVVPSASKALPEDKGHKMHANVRFLDNPSASPSELPPYLGYGYETPASLACVYGLVPKTKGCNPNTTTTNSTLGSQTIAIVDAYDDPNAAADLAYFSQQFGLPYSDSKFHVVYAPGMKPPEDPTGGWELEEALDIEYAHAMAPNATIYLVEAASTYDSDLFYAVQVASNLVVCGKTTTCPKGSTGKGEVSMSFSGGEFSQESYYDSVFTTPGVVYLSASGDAAGTGFPCVSPNVVCVGGTSNSRSIETGDLMAQIGWSDAGSGISYYEPIPSYQKSHPQVAKQLGGYRGVPDISANANPTTGAWVWTTYPYEGSETGWFTIGGTSLATPLSAGLVNATGGFALSSAEYLADIYAATPFVTDITYGSCYYYSAYYAAPGWDLCTGMGSPKLR
ncbi:MAG TPA: S53 family peptidase [Acidobacteriaceae bacterium]